MGDIKQKRLSEGPILNLNKRYDKQNSLKKKFDTWVKESMFFRSWKNKQRSIPRSKVISGKPPEDVWYRVRDFIAD